MILSTCKITRIEVMNMDNKRKVGRPKLADKSLKKKSLIISGICLIVVIVLILTGIKILNIKPNKLKGSTPIYKTYEIGEEFCLGDESDCFYVIENDDDSVIALAKTIISSAPTTFYSARVGSFGYDSSHMDSINEIYKNYLIETYDVSNLQIQLLTLYQANNLGCNIDDRKCVNSPDWLTNTSSFWLKDGYLISGNTYYGSQNRSYISNSYRPVIIINKSEISDVIGYRDSEKYEIGQEFCLDTECFYTIRDNGDAVTALSKYNIDVESNRQSESFTQLQFTSSNYWNENNSLNEKYGTTYPAFVFDENSNLWQPVQNYQNYLKEDLDNPSLEATLISYQQIMKLSNNSTSLSLASQWLYSTRYWTGSASSSDAYAIYDSNLDLHGSCYYGGVCGIRPVITITKNDILGIKEEPVEITTTEEKISTTEKNITTTSTTKKTVKQTSTTIVDIKTTTKKNKNVINRNMATTTRESTITSTAKEESSKVEITKIESATANKENSNKNKKYPLIGIGIIICMSLIGFIVYKKK